MLRSIAAAALGVAVMSAPALAAELEYKCSVNDARLELNLSADFSYGGKLTGMSGSFVVKGGNLEEKLTLRDVGQSWTSDRHLNVQFGNDRKEWLLMVETNCNSASSCSGDYVASQNQNKEVKGAIRCSKRIN